MKSNKIYNNKKSLLVLSFAILLYLSSFFHISPAVLGFSNYAQYPIVLQNMIAVLSGVLLGGTQGAGAVGLYLALGALGLPIFSTSILVSSQGFERLSSESGGFLVGYFLASLVAGLIVKNPEKGKQPLKKIIQASLFGYAIIWLLGILQYMHVKEIRLSLSSLETIFYVLIQPYIFFDVIKLLFTIIVAVFLRPRISVFFKKEI